MNAKAEQFGRFCTACVSDFLLTMAVITNVAILGILATMLWAMRP